VILVCFTALLAIDSKALVDLSYWLGTSLLILSAVSLAPQWIISVR
jgi:hypothetical protein